MMARTRGLAMFRDASLPALPHVPRPLATRMHITTFSRSFSLALMPASHPRLSSMSSALDRAIASPVETWAEAPRSIAGGAYPIGLDRLDKTRQID